MSIYRQIYYFFYTLIYKENIYPIAYFAQNFPYRVENQMIIKRFFLSRQLHRKKSFAAWAPCSSAFRALSRQVQTGHPSTHRCARLALPRNCRNFAAGNMRGCSRSEKPMIHRSPLAKPQPCRRKQARNSGAVPHRHKMREFNSPHPRSRSAPLPHNRREASTTRIAFYEEFKCISNNFRKRNSGSSVLPQTCCSFHDWGSFFSSEPARALRLAHHTPRSPCISWGSG